MEASLVVVKVNVTKFSFLILCIFFGKNDMKTYVYQRHLDEPRKSSFLYENFG
jgi:hypothetical protein